MKGESGLSPIEIARKRIEKACGCGEQSLDLSDLGLEELPEPLELLAKFRELNLSNNRLQRLPEAAIQNVGLWKLDVSHNELPYLPQSIEQLTQLQELRAWNNRLSALPEAIGRLTELRFLDVGRNRLGALTEAISQLTALHFLGLNDNRLAELPDAIGRLTALHFLSVNNNRLEVLPDAISRLTALRDLDLSRNQLAALPESIGRLTALQDLNLCDNRLSALPDSVGQLCALLSLNLRRNQLTALPDAVGKLSILQSLELGHNRLTVLSDDPIGRLTALQTLDLSFNQLAALPDIVGQIASLQNLFLTGNKLAALPDSLRHLPRLRQLFLHENEKLEIPPEILGGDGRGSGSGRTPARPADILAYYFRNRVGRTRPLHEAKILIVGQGEVGKTSLVRFLVDDLACDQFEAQTDGIAIRGWEVQAAPRPRAAKQTVRVNVWDFGGQEIMHSTHQFFLTHRSLYVLVLSARQGEAENNLHYWLKCIQSYGGQSPVLVVVNKSEGKNYLELNERRLLADYQPNLIGFIRVSCKRKTGRAALLKEIQKQIGKLPHVFDAVPEDFFAVKEGLAELAKQRDFLDYMQYESLCDEKRVRDKGDQQRLIRFLHDLGAALYFNDPHNPLRLSDTHVLNPEWVTGGVYRIITSPLLRDAKGKLDAKTLTEILSEARYPPRRHRFLLDLMEKFDIGFEIPDSHGGRWLVPCVLPKDEPAGLNWDAPGLLHFELHYDILPSGFIGRFIVRMQRHVAEPYWRNGAVLTIEDNTVLLRADADKSRILIRVGGPANSRRDALAVVRNAFESLRATFPRLEVKERVPLPDNPDITVGYQHLREMEAKREIIYWPEGASHRYRIAELLDGIDPPDRRPARADRGRPVNIHIGDKTVEVDGDVIGSTIDQGLIDGDVENQGTSHE